MDTNLPSELVFARTDWERMLRGLLARRGRWALARLRRNQHGSRMEFIARQVQLPDAVPSGPQFLPLADWAAITAPGDVRRRVERTGRACGRHQSAAWPDDEADASGGADCKTCRPLFGVR